MKAEASAGDQPRSAPFDIFSPSTVLTVALEVCFVVLLLRILVALYRLNKAVKLPGQAAGRSPPSAAQQPLPKTHGSAPPHALRSSPASTSSAPPKSVGCVAGLAAAEFGDLSVPHAWSPVDHRDIKLRVGPNYKKNKKKAPSGPALLQCVGVDLISAPRKVFSDGACDAACLPPEIAAAAAEQTPPPGSGGPLPRFLVVTISMPKYSSGATDGPNMRWAVFHGVHPSLRDDTSPPARLLCEFLDGAVTGHADKQSTPAGRPSHSPCRAWCIMRTVPCSPLPVFAHFVSPCLAARRQVLRPVQSDGARARARFQSRPVFARDDQLV